MDRTDQIITPLMLVVLQQMGLQLESINGQLAINNDTLQKIRDFLQTADLASMVKNDIADSKSLKRRLIRVQVMTGNKNNMVTQWEHSLFSTLGMNRRDVIRSCEKHNCNTTLWDALDVIPEYRSAGIEILKSFERKYNIPKAIYSVEQVRNIGALSREFDYTAIMAMDNSEFHRWLGNRMLEFETLFDCGIQDGRGQAYNLLALSCPELIQEKLLKYMAPQELVNVLDRAMEEECTYHQRLKTGPFFPLSDRKIESDSVKGRFINIILRCLIV